MRLGLVAPDWRVWFIASDSEDARRASLRQLVDALGIDWKLAGNLRQLVGLMVGLMTRAHIVHPLLCRHRRRRCLHSRRRTRRLYDRRWKLSRWRWREPRES